MKHDEKHAALAAYAFWCKLEQTGEDKGELLHYYKTLFDVENDNNMCHACVIAAWYRMQNGSRYVCGNCPCDWYPRKMCLSMPSPYALWQMAPKGGKGKKKCAGDVANVMRKWCERVGVIAPMGE